jgi:hypothetical protein
MRANRTELNQQARQEREREREREREKAALGEQITIDSLEVAIGDR